MFWLIWSKLIYVEPRSHLRSKRLLHIVKLETQCAIIISNYKRWKIDIEQLSNQLFHIEKPVLKLEMQENCIRLFLKRIIIKVIPLGNIFCEEISGPIVEIYQLEKNITAKQGLTCHPILNQHLSFMLQKIFQ